MNGSAGQVLWTTPDGWTALTFANGEKAGENWEIREDHLRKFCPLDEGGYWAALWDACFNILDDPLGRECNRRKSDR